MKSSKKSKRKATPVIIMNMDAPESEIDEVKYIVAFTTVLKNSGVAGVQEKHYPVGVVPVIPRKGETFELEIPWKESTKIVSFKVRDVHHNIKYEPKDGGKRDVLHTIEIFAREFDT